MPRPLPGVGYVFNSTNKGFSLDIEKDTESFFDIENYIKFNPFTCIIENAIVGGTTVHRLKIKKGTVTYSWAVSDLGVTGPGGLCPYFYDIDKVNLFPNGSRTNGSDANSEYLNDGGYVTLAPGYDYVVFVYMLAPKYEVENPSEFNVPQLCVSRTDQLPATNINDADNISGRTSDINSWLTIGISAQYIGFKYKNTFSLRSNIATIFWDDFNSKFVITQLNNYPNMKFAPQVIGGGNTEPYFDDSTVNSIKNAISGYTKDLNNDAVGYNVVEQGEP